MWLFAIFKISAISNIFIFWCLLIFFNFFKFSSAFRVLSLQVFGLLLEMYSGSFMFFKFQVFLWFFRKIFSVSFNLSIVLRLLKCEITQLVEKLNSELDEKVKTVLFSGERKMSFILLRWILLFGAPVGRPTGAWIPN